MAALRRVDCLSELDGVALEELAQGAVERRYAAGAAIVTELEFGTDVYIITSGTAEVSVCSQLGKRRILGELGEGDSFGEMASITGELRSASVRSLTNVTVLCLPDKLFDRLRIYRPEVATRLIYVMAERLAETERRLSVLLALRDSLGSEELAPPRSTMQLLWRELVVNHRKDLAFLTLLAFALSLALVRTVIHFCFEYAFAPRQVLRAFYVSGFGLVIASAGTALLSYRPFVRRAIALAFGIGSAFIINELGVTLAFDIYYKDIFTADPTLVFDVERLYRRTEPHAAIVVGFVLLFQAVYLKDFYGRVLHLLRLRTRRLLHRRMPI